MPRVLAFCNYVLASAGSFVVQDLAADESFQWLAAKAPFQCYVGTAIKDATGRPIVVLCMFDTEARPDFDTTHEKQLEQMACLISQSIENRALERSMEHLENKQNIISQGRDKQIPPQKSVTLVLTNIKGCFDTLETNAPAIQSGQRLHNNIFKDLCERNFGYKIESNGYSFELAFHDPVDAFGFALQVQMAGQKIYFICLLQWTRQEPCEVFVSR